MPQMPMMSFALPRAARAGLCIAAITVAVYAASLANGFVGWDDGLLITDNPIVRGITPANVRAAFTQYDPELYLPLTYVSYQLNYLLGGLQPFGYHLVNLLLHVVNACLFALIARQLTQRPWASFVAALIFALHPLHVEAVAWASARKDVLSAAFVLGSLFLWLRWRATGAPWRYCLSLTLFVCALLSKVTVLVLPAVLLGVHLARAEVSLRRIALLAPYASLSAVFAVIALFGKVAPSGFLFEKLLMACKGTMFALRALVWPMGLSVFYPYTDPLSLRTPELLFSCVAVIIITVTCVAWWRRSRLPLIAWGLFLLLLLPSFGNAVKGRNELLDIYFFSDRYAYLASMLPLLGIGVAMDALRRRSRLAAIGTVVGVLAVLGALTVRQSFVWQSSETLFRHAIHHYPNAYIAHGNLGTEYVRQGKVDEGLRAYAAAIAIRPDGVTYYNIGLILEARGNIEGAILAYRSAVRARPLEADAWYRLGGLLLEGGQVDEGQAAMEEAVRLGHPGM